MTTNISGREGENTQSAKGRRGDDGASSRKEEKGGMFVTPCHERVKRRGKKGLINGSRSFSTRWKRRSRC